MEIKITQNNKTVTGNIDDALSNSLKLNHGLSDLDIVTSLCDIMLYDSTADYKQLLQEESA